jgi:hypothetical protein
VRLSGPSYYVVFDRDRADRDPSPAGHSEDDIRKMFFGDDSALKEVFGTRSGSEKEAETAKLTDDTLNLVESVSSKISSLSTGKSVMTPKPEPETAQASPKVDSAPLLLATWSPPAVDCNVQSVLSALEPRVRLTPHALIATAELSIALLKPSDVTIDVSAGQLKLSARGCSKVIDLSARVVGDATSAKYSKKLGCLSITMPLSE